MSEPSKVDKPFVRKADILLNDYEFKTISLIAKSTDTPRPQLLGQIIRDALPALVRSVIEKPSPQ